MARPESIALGGYFPTPVHLIPLVAGLIDARHARSLNSSKYAVIDPCAGDGEALRLLIDQWWGSTWDRFGHSHNKPAVYACELEKGRHEGLRRWGNELSSFYFHAEHGDAFQVSWGDEANGQILFLNPPYDIDKEHGRLEHRFLLRFTQCLAKGSGILIYLVPHYALASSAIHLAEEYRDIHCFRFPDPDFDVFKQVVLVARRRATPDMFGAARSPIVATVNQWSEDAGSIPVLNGRSVLSLPEKGEGEFREWKVLELDVRGAYEGYRPFADGKGRPVYGLDLELGMDELIGSRYPVVLPPKPAHTAIALASGLVNGREVGPDDPESGLPLLLVKGIFDREYNTVDTRVNKEGKITSIIQVEQPKLRVSVLDMDTWLYTDLADGIEPTGETAVNKMNVADLLTHYGLSLASLMRQQCPPLHDPGNPAHDFPLPVMKTPLFGAQRHLVLAGLKQLFTDDPAFAGESPFVLGEVGTGKTAVALAITQALTPAHFGETKAKLAGINISGGRAKTVRRVLVVCPPHLLKGWSNEVVKFLPDARTVVLERISDVIAARADDNEGLIIYLLSREMAKLGHIWADGRWQDRCPTCGTVIRQSDKDIINKRLRCEHRPRTATNGWARWARELAGVLYGASRHHHAEMLVDGRFAQRQAEKPRPAEDREELWQKRCQSLPLAQTVIGKFLNLMRERIAKSELSKVDGDLNWVIAALKAIDHPERDQWIASFVLDLYPRTLTDRSQYGPGPAIRRKLEKLLLFMKDVGSRLQMDTWTAVREMYGFNAAWIDGQIDRLKDERNGESSWRRQECEVKATGGSLVFGYGFNDDLPLGSVKAAEALLEALVEKGKWEDGRVCDTPLFQAVPQPRRVPLATYITRYAKDLFDLLIVDEAHEYSHDGSAQERAAHRLVGLGKPVLALTGTSNNGYASSLFANMWALSPRFRREFGREDKATFVNRYGYRKVKIEPDDDDNDWQARYGAMTDLVDTGDGLRRRKIGEAPGVMPVFILKHLLPAALPIHKDDLDVDLPPLVELRKPVKPDGVLSDEYDSLEHEVMEVVKQEWTSGTSYAGKLWGCVAQLPFYLDRAHEDTGNEQNSHRRHFVFRYPQSGDDERAGTILAEASPLSADFITAKETWLLETIARELDEKRPVTVFVWNTGDGYLPARLLRLVQAEFGNVGVFLDAQKVQANKRQEWIDRHVIGKKKKVLLVNPRAVETGLNNLVYFPTAIWQQNPNCSPIIYQQANGRFHRPGQEYDEVRVYVPYYTHTSQSPQMELLAQKVQASKQTDGLDVTSALVAAGAGGTDGLNVMAVGRAIYELLLRGERPVTPVNGHAVSVKVHRNGNGHVPDIATSAPAAGMQMSLFGES